MNSGQGDDEDEQGDTEDTVKALNVHDAVDDWATDSFSNASVSEAYFEVALMMDLLGGGNSKGDGAATHAYERVGSM